ncbi:serine hydrolase domain-containing protein [Rossellomorea marisflavi]|uniref:serine hydrolase domain-containing protein n=1 Tax=Rossellomorea marisflavi TaxID=189381 RepID=UPI00064FB624|nr:serine hydrolase domain-containing protein [Rossellomorea marisflavi]KML33670.1 hypothetical protein VL12_08345 [Rossellomorea marisflavi]
MKNEYDLVMDFLEKHQLFNGVIMIADKGVPVYERRVGKRNEASPLTSQSVFEIASLTKPFTGACIMMLVEEGGLSLSDELAAFFPHLSFPGVTVGHLLHHTSGLPDYMEWFEDKWDRTNMVTNADVVKCLETLPAEFLPGERWEYCNSGYVLLAEIIALKSGMTYEEFVNRRIFEPLGMSRSSLSSVFVDGPPKDYATGYVVDGEGRIELPANLADHEYVVMFDRVKGDGGIKSTAEDLMKWEQGLFSGSLLSEESVQQIVQPAVLKDGRYTDYCPALHEEHYGGYGAGWKIEEHLEYGKIAMHDGYWAGYCHGLVKYLHLDKTLLLLSNHDFIGEGYVKIPHLLTLAMEKVIWGEDADLTPFRELLSTP